jgi:hypothetical protein
MFANVAAAASARERDLCWEFDAEDSQPKSGIQLRQAQTEALNPKPTACTSTSTSTTTSSRLVVSVLLPLVD